MQLVRTWALLVLFTTAFQLSAADDAKAEQKFTAMLIWGTDEEKPLSEKDLKDVPPALKEKFGKIFKWKNYFEVTRTDVSVKVGEPKHFKLSKKCEVKINRTEKEGMEVELIGENKTVYKGKHSMPLKDMLILAGDDKNANAWFVILMPNN